MSTSLPIYALPTFLQPQKRINFFKKKTIITEGDIIEQNNLNKRKEYLVAESKYNT